MEEDRECEGLQQRKACRVVATIVANARVYQNRSASVSLSLEPQRERERYYESHRETERERQRTLSLGLKLAPGFDCEFEN